MIAALLYGPTYTSREPSPDTIEVFANIEEAITALIERHRSHGRKAMHVAALDGTDAAYAFPAFGIGHYLQCYEIGPGNHSDVLEELLPFTEEQQQNIVAMVGNHEWDWHLSLNDDGYGHYVKVSKA